MDVQANGTTLYAEQTGDGPSLVFVHGMCGDGRVWADQVNRLADRFRCTTYDRRGHTRSPRTDVAETVELHADDLAGLIVALDLAPTTVVGACGRSGPKLTAPDRPAGLVNSIRLVRPSHAAGYRSRRGWLSKQQQAAAHALRNAPGAGDDLGALERFT